jgi:hypothetical protein
MAIEKDHRKTALIVAGGPSAAIMRTFRVNKSEIAIIAVNGALDWCRYFDYWFTLDPTKVNRKRMRTYRHNAKYFIAFPKGWILIPSYTTRLERYSPDPSPTREPEFEDGKLTCAIGLNTAPNTINSGNSAFGALGLAYHLGFEKVGLIGVDANNAERVDGGFSRDLSHLPALFESAMHQIDLVNCGDMVSQIPTMSIRDFAAGVPHLSTKIMATQGMDAAVEDLNLRSEIRVHSITQPNARSEPIEVLAESAVSELIDPVTLTPLRNNDPTNPNPLATHGDLVLHQDVGVRKESPGTHVPLPYLTTVL